VPLHLDLGKDLAHLSGLVENVRSPDDAHGLAPVQVLLLPDAVRFQHLVRGVACQRKIQPVLVAELLKFLNRVTANTQNFGSQLVQFFFGVTELVRLAGSTRSVGLGEEVEN